MLDVHLWLLGRRAEYDLSADPDWAILQAVRGRGRVARLLFARLRNGARRVQAVRGHGDVDARHRCRLLHRRVTRLGVCTIPEKLASRAELELTSADGADPHGLVWQRPHGRAEAGCLAQQRPEAAGPPQNALENVPPARGARGPHAAAFIAGNMLFNFAMVISAPVREI